MQHSYEGLDRSGRFSRVRLLAPLHNRDFRRLWGGMCVSLLGDGVFLVALVWQAYALSNSPSALAVVGMPDLELQDLLLAKLVPKIGGYRLLLRFGEAFGLSRADFDAVKPLAGCMALTNFFYWMLAYGSVPEKIAAVGASEDIFIKICARVGPALLRNYAMSAEQIAFFTAHEEIGEQVTPIDAHLLARYQTKEDRQRITRAVRLSHEFELLFYDTVLASTTSVT